MNSKSESRYLTKYILPILTVFALYVIGYFLCGTVGGLSFCLLGALVIRCIFSICADFQVPASDDDKEEVLPDLLQSSGEGKDEPKADKLRDYAYILLYVLIVRIAVYLIAYIAASSNGIAEGGFFDRFAKIWTGLGTDASHYLGIAENWYVTEGDPMYHIVFFPLFPMLVAVFKLVFGSSLISATILNLLLSFGIGIGAYELALLDYDRKTALRFVRYIFIIPAAFFYAAPMTESLFVFLCIMCIYAARKDCYFLAGIIGALAAFTRMQGILLLVPCGYIALRHYILNSKNKGELGALFVRCAKLCLMFVGIGIYLFINYSLWGTPFKFMEFQREHWQQSLGFFGNTAKMIFDNFIHHCKNMQVLNFAQDQSAKFAFSLWLPQLIYIIASPVFLKIATHNRGDKQKFALDTSYSLFFVVYYVISCGATWLLSAPRYLMACISLPLGLAILGRKRSVDIISTAVCIILGGVYLYMYCTPGYIY